MNNKFCCPVCLIDYIDIEKKYILYCGHTLCGVCIRKFRQDICTRVICPMCRLNCIFKNLNYNDGKCPNCNRSYANIQNSTFSLMNCSHIFCSPCLVIDTIEYHAETKSYYFIQKQYTCQICKVPHKGKRKVFF